MDSSDTYPTPNDILETKEKNSLLYIALNKKIRLLQNNSISPYEGVLKKVQGNFILLECEELKKKIKHIRQIILPIASIRFIEILS